MNHAISSGLGPAAKRGRTGSFWLILAFVTGCSSAPLGSQDGPRGALPGSENSFSGQTQESGAELFARLQARSDEIGLQHDDTIFTASARTVDFNGQAFIARLNVLRATSLYRGNHKVRDPKQQELTVLAPVIKGVVGLSPELTLNVSVPYISKELKTRRAGRRVRLNASGLGDVSVVGKWRFFQDPGVGSSTEMAAFLGAKLPTGRDDVRDGGLRLPQPLQPGSGSLDGILGAAFTRVWDGGRWLVNADLFYKVNSEAHDYRFGDIFNFDVGAQFRIYPERYESFDQTTVNLVLELNGVLAGRDSFRGDNLQNTGGLKLFLSPGLQVIVSEALLFEGGIQIPIYRDLNGPQLAEDFRATVGLRWRF